MKGHEEFSAVAARVYYGPPGAPDETWAVDDLALPFGLDALHAAATAATRASFHHAQDLDRIASSSRMEKALRDVIAACDNIIAEANLSPIALKAADFRECATGSLSNIQPQHGKRGSPGRVVQQAAAEAAAAVWASGTGRPIPRRGRVDEGHSLAALLRAVSTDLFESPAALTVSLLRTKK